MRCDVLTYLVDVVPRACDDDALRVGVVPTVIDPFNFAPSYWAWVIDYKNGSGDHGRCKMSILLANASIGVSESEVIENSLSLSRLLSWETGMRALQQASQRGRHHLAIGR